MKYLEDKVDYRLETYTGEVVHIYVQRRRVSKKWWWLSPKVSIDNIEEQALHREPKEDYLNFALRAHKLGGELVEKYHKSVKQRAEFKKMLESNPYRTLSKMVK